MTRKYFGTDGVRGKVGEYPITPDFVMKLGWAACKVLSKKGTKKVLIGKDTGSPATCWNRRWKRASPLRASRPY